MQYSEAMDYLYSRLPVFHRIGAKALKPGLANTLRLCEALDNPQNRFRSIHVAGTNGKGSTSHMLAAIYQSAGYRVGLYTSPHLKSFTERIRLNGQPIAEGEVARFVVDYQTLIESIEPSFFEVTVAMAFDYFARQSVDIAIIEVGLGGLLDSTNVITPLISVITNIGLDHTDILGHTLPEIARQKAGIIKPGVPVVVGETVPETEPVFRETASLANASVRFADQEYTVLDNGLLEGVRQVLVAGPVPTNSQEHDTSMNQGMTLSLDLMGDYQLRNLPAVLATVHQLQSLLPVGLSALEEGLRHTITLTGLKGRFQTIRESPRVLVDTAHNQPGLVALFTAINAISFSKLHLIIGLVADKDRTDLLTILPRDATYYFCQAHTPRSLPATVLQTEAQLVGLAGDSYPDVNQALQAALQRATTTDLILITGSNYTIAELTDL